MNKQTIRNVKPTVETLDDRSVPAAVWQDAYGTIFIRGGRFRDCVQVTYTDFGDVMVWDGFQASVFAGWSVTGIQFRGGFGNDCFYNYTDFGCWGWGGWGNDYLWGGGGYDYFWGGMGIDRIWGGGGYDYMWGGYDDDWLYYDSFDGTVNGGFGFDQTFVY